MIRKMRIEDLPFVKSLMQSIPLFWHDVWTDKTLERAFAASEDLALVYELDHQIVGCIFGYDLGFRAYIGGLAISEEMRNRGIGKELLQYVEDVLKKRGCELIIADIWKSAEPFYRKLGWEEPQAVLLRKRLIEK
ncbi:GNAT family N-acetyltransferase [candidate division WOR-3 bacterium]|nr:GNAT family N-acetyltransferase [candidate division WOR-3 bacterium]